MSAQQDYSGFFSDLPTEDVASSPPKPSKANFFSDIGSSRPVPSQASNNAMEGEYSGFFADLNQPQQAFPENAPQTVKEPGFLSRLKSRMDQSMQVAQMSGGYAGAPALTPKQAKRAATEVGTIAAVEAAFIPVLGAAGASLIAPKLLTSLARLTQAGTTGAAVATTGKLVEEGELPSQEELVKEGLTWMAIDGIMQGLHASAGAGKKVYDFGKAVGNIAKEEGVPATDVLKRLWTSTKNYVKQKFGKDIRAPEDITPQDVEVLIDKTKKAEEVIEPKEIEAKEAEPKEIEAEPKKVEAIKSEDFEYTREDFPTKKEAQGYLEHLHTSLEKAPEAHKAGLQKDIRNLEALIAGFEQEAPIEPVEKEPEERSVSKYERKPEPKTYKEKIVHLAGKIKDSQDYIDKLKPAIANNKFLLEDAQAKLEALPKEVHVIDSKLRELNDKKNQEYRAARHEQQDKINNLRWQLENKRDSLKAEQAYLKQLKQDIRDLKEQKEASKVTVPLGGAEKPLSKGIKQPRTPEREPKAPIMGKKQAVARSKVMDLFRKAFNDPMIVSKKKMYLKQASGEHHLWSRISRLVKENNIETAAHEIGHNLHTLLYGGDAKTPTEQADNIHRVLRPHLDELKPLALYEPWGMEGFAEFTRMYVTNPDVALKLAPKFYAKFEADLEAQHPDLKNALLEARDYYDSYLQGTPESRIRAQTNYAEDASKLDNLVDWVKEKLDLDKLKTNFLDDVFPAKRLVAEAFGIPTTEVENLNDPRNLYRSLRVLKGAIGKADVFLTHQTFDAKTLKRKGRGLRQIMRKLKTPEAYKEFNDYLIARRTVEKAQQGIETGIEYGDAIVGEKNLASKYKKLAILLDHYNDALLTYARDSGLLSEEQYAMIKKNNMMYAPFQRMHERETGRMAATGGKLQAGKPIKRMKGSRRDIIAPIESVIKNTYAIIVNSEKNLSGQVLAKLSLMKNIGPYVQRVPTPTELKGKVFGEQIADRLAKEFLQQGLDDLIEFEGEGKVKLRDDIASAIPEVFLRFGPTNYPAGEKIVTVFMDGKPNYFEVSPEIYEMWTKGIAPYTADIITKILRIPARTLRAGAILNPRFMQKNFIRDTWGGFLFTKYGKDIKDPAKLLIDTLYSPLAQLATAAKQAKLYVEWMKAGGGMSTMQSLDRDAVLKKLKEVRDGLSPHQVIKWLRKVAEISEEGNRLAEFSRALEVEGHTRLGKEMAAFASRDLSIDFAKMGLQTKALNQIIPFWNATVQGGDKLLRTLASDQDRAEFIARAIGFILVPSLILAYLNQDDERVKEFYEEEKDFNFITFIGDTALKIPVPFETGVIVHGLTQRMYNYFMNKDPHAFEGFMGSIRSATLPNFIPAFANPLVEVEANKNFFTGARIIPQSKKDLIAKYQYKNNTSVTARLLGRAMAYMLGQDTRSKAASPAVIDHFINSWGAGLGRTVVAILDEGLKAAGLGDEIPKPDQASTERLGLDAFIARYPRSSTRSIEKFYDYYADATTRQRSIKHAEKIELEEPEEIQKAHERVEKLYDYPTLKRAYKAMQMSQRAINETWISPDIDSETKKTMIDDLYLQQIQFAKAAVEDIERYRLARKGA